jgi:CRP-like cAMP-binding protein
MFTPAQIGVVPQFAVLATDVQSALQELVQVYQLSVGEYLFHQGDLARCFYAVGAGGVRLIEHTPSGKSVTLKIYGQGELLGLLAVSGTFPHPASVQAVEASVMLALDGQHARQLMLRYPTFALTIVDLLVEHVHNAHRRIRHVIADPAEARLAQALLQMYEKFGLVSGQPHTVATNVSQQDLAEFAGTTVETVNRILRTWEQAGFIQRARRQINIYDFIALQQIAHTSPPSPHHDEST